MKTQSGTDVVDLWHCPMPDGDRRDAGFPPPDEVAHVEVFHATRETGGYNHHSALIWHDGAFYAMWSNHPSAEDAPGMRVLYSRSTDGKRWTQFEELFPPPGPVRHIDHTGPRFAASGWLLHDRRVWALAELSLTTRFRGMDPITKQTVFAERRDERHRFPAGRSAGACAREVHPDGRLGPIFAVAAEDPPELLFELADGRGVAPSVAERFEGLYVSCDRVPGAAELRRWPYDLSAPRMREMAARASGDALFPVPKGVNGEFALCEPAIYRASGGGFRMLLRDGRYSHRLFVSTFDDATRSWAPARPTNIPDSPSQSAVLELPGGALLLVGSQMAPRFDNPDEVRHYGRNPLTFAVSDDREAFSRVFSLHVCSRETEDGWRDRVGGIFGGRAGGGQYPSAIVVNGRLCVLYSVGKVDINFSTVPLKVLALDETTSEQ